MEIRVVFEPVAEELVVSIASGYKQLCSILVGEYRSGMGTPDLCVFVSLNLLSGADIEEPVTNLFTWHDASDVLILIVTKLRDHKCACKGLRNENERNNRCPG